jgi:gamma-tubulin complex component 4
MLPDYIQVPVAESILFVGKAVRVLRNPSTSFKVQTSGSQRPGSKGQQRPDEILISLPFSKDSSAGRGSSERPGLLPEAEATKIASMIRDLKVQPAVNYPCAKCCTPCLFAR